MAKHRSAWTWYWNPYWLSPRQTQTWFEAICYRPRHRGVYDWFIGTSLGRRQMGELSIKIKADLKQFDRELVEALRMPGFLGTLPDAPWVVWRE